MEVVKEQRPFSFTKQEARNSKREQTKGNWFFSLPLFFLVLCVCILDRVWCIVEPDCSEEDGANPTNPTVGVSKSQWKGKFSPYKLLVPMLLTFLVSYPLVWVLKRQLMIGNFVQAAICVVFPQWTKMHLYIFNFKYFKYMQVKAQDLWKPFYDHPTIIDFQQPLQ